jgi:hypothetical protein
MFRSYVDFLFDIFPFSLFDKLTVLRLSLCSLHYLFSFLIFFCQFLKIALLELVRCDFLWRVKLIFILFFFFYLGYLVLFLLETHHPSLSE